MKAFLFISMMFMFSTGFAQLPNQPVRDSLLRVLAVQPADTQRVLSWLSYAATYRYNEERAGFPALDSATALATKLSWPNGLARAELQRGVYVGDTGNNQQSLVHFRYALDYDRKTGNYKRIAKDLALIARAFNRMSDFPNALKAGLESVDLAENAQDDSLLANMLGNLVITYLDHKNYPKGTELALRAKAVAEKVNARGDLVDALQHLAYIRYHEKKMPEVKALLREALRIALTLNEPVTAGDVMAQLGEAERDSPAVALAHLSAARDIFASVNPKAMNHANVLTQIGRVLDDSASRTSGARQRLLLDSAIASEKKAAGILLNSKNRQYLVTVYEYLSQFESETGNFSAAYDYDMKGDVIYDSLFSQKKKDQLASLQDKHDLELRNKEIELDKLAATGQRRALTAVGGGMLLLAVIGWQLVRQNRFRKKNNDTLMVLNQQLSEANKVKARFFGILSHDLRSPIRDLLGYLQLVKNEPGALSAAEEQQYQQQIGRSAEDLLETMESMLLWSKEQMDSFKPDLRRIEVEDLFLYLQKFFSREQTIAFRFLNPGNAVVTGDENYLRVIMQNLTSNALKALDKNPAGWIEWKATREGDFTLLSITDNGPGLNKEEARALRGETAEVTASSGFGFQLIRDLARAIQYTVSFDSEAGKGTTFTLQFARPLFNIAPTAPA